MDEVRYFVKLLTLKYPAGFHPEIYRREKNGELTPFNAQHMTAGNQEVVIRIVADESEYDETA